MKINNKIILQVAKNYIHIFYMSMEIASINLKPKISTFGCLDKSKKFEKISDIPNLPCAKCGNPLLTLEQSKGYFLDIRNNNLESNNKYLPSKDTIKIFNEAKRYLPPFEQKILLRLNEYARKYPDCTFEEIFQKPEVVQSFVEENEQRIVTCRQNCDKVFDRMNEILPDLTGEEKLLLDDLNKKAFIVSIGKYDNTLKKVKLTNIYAEFIANVIKNEKSRYDFKKEINNIPLVSQTENGFLTSFIGKSDDKILNMLLTNCISTDYFVRPQNRDYGNALRVCCKCNTENSSMNFNQAIALYPEFVINIKKQIDILISLISKGHLKKINKYPEMIKNTIFSETNGRFNLNIDGYINYCKKVILAQKKWEENFMNTHEDLVSIKQRMNFIIAKLKELRLSPKVNAEKITQYEHYYKLCQTKYARELERYHK